MKLTVEIKDGKFIFDYEVGENRHHGEHGICADSLCLFTALLQNCHQTYKFRDKEWEREAIAKAWAEKQKVREEGE